MKGDKILCLYIIYLILKYNEMILKFLKGKHFFQHSYNNPFLNQQKGNGVLIFKHQSIRNTYIKMNV